MCERNIMLARLDQRRWISSCEYQMAHLAWDHVSLRLPLPQLHTRGQALLECAQVAQQFRIAGTDEVCVILDQYDLYQVWLGGVGLCLSAADMQHFCRLISDACAHPAAQASARDHAPTHPVDQAPIRTTYHLFSVN